jgi:protein tyrosine/serine phosphatase
MISIIPGQPDTNLADFCNNDNIAHHLSASLITEILHVICNSANLPLYIHSTHGDHTAGLVIACLRKRQHWSHRAVIIEFNQFVSDTVEPGEEEFLKQFSPTFDLSVEIPVWMRHVFAKDKNTERTRSKEEEEDESDSGNDGEDREAYRTVEDDVESPLGDGDGD